MLWPKVGRVWSQPNILLNSVWICVFLFCVLIFFITGTLIFLVWFSQNPSASIAEGTQLSRDSDLSPGQPLQPGMPSSGVGVIGRRSVSDFGAIGDNLSGTSATSGHDQLYNLQMLEAAYHRLPQPKDSERARNYTPVWMLVYLCSHQMVLM